MAQWISACLFALSANIDNFPIGIAYGPVSYTHLLQAARLDEFTYRRTIRKICESHQVNAEQKSHLRALERRRHG